MVLVMLPCHLLTGLTVPVLVTFITAVSGGPIAPGAAYTGSLCPRGFHFQGRQGMRCNGHQGLVKPSDRHSKVQRAAGGERERLCYGTNQLALRSKPLWALLFSPALQSMWANRALNLVA